MSRFRPHHGLILCLGLVWGQALRAEITVDDAGRFAVDIALPVKRSNAEADSGLGKTVLHLLTHDGENSTGFILGYNDYPAGSIAKLDPDKTYDNIINGVVGNFKGGVLRTKGAHTLGDATGREYFLDSEPLKLVGRVRCYLVGDRLYQIMYLGPPGTENGAEALHFLDSFRLLR